jgi:hypothetical protein
LKILLLLLLLLLDSQQADRTNRSLGGREKLKRQGQSLIGLDNEGTAQLLPIMELEPELGTLQARKRDSTHRSGDARGSMTFGWH